MSKGLEELKDLKNAFIGHCKELKCEENYIKVCENKFSKIEKELKEYEQYEQILNDYGLNLCNFREACLLLAMLKGSGLNIHDIGKQLKALDVIKEIDKTSLLHFLAICVKDQNKYDLLKEVLL